MIYVDGREEGKLKLRDGKCKVVAIQVVKGMLVKKKNRGEKYRDEGMGHKSMLQIICIKS